MPTDDGPGGPSPYGAHVLVLVIRHAYAGDKASWPGPDADRPLDATGHADAEALARAIGDLPVERVASSPTRRCLDTVAPFARARRLSITPCEDLAVGSPRPLLDVVLGATAPMTLCTHGEAMGPLLDALRGTATVDAALTDDEWLLRKGTAWALRVDGRTVTHLRHITPRSARAHSGDPAG